jgi:hypothetical protein
MKKEFRCRVVIITYQNVVKFIVFIELFSYSGNFDLLAFIRPIFLFLAEKVLMFILSICSNTQLCYLF